MLTSQRNRKYRVLAEMNLLPMIDVALVLLLIFMITTPLLVRSQLKINLPKAKTVETTPPPRQIIQIAMDKSGAIYINGQPVQARDLENKLKAVVVDPEHQPIVIEADKDIPFHHVVAVLDSAKRLGVAKVGVSVKKDPEGRSRSR
jgi:biopolymer transport protein TolR